MSIVLSYKFNTDVLGEESISSTDMTNTGVTSVVDATYGKVAYFDGSSYLTLASGSTPVSMTGNNSRAVSYWLKLDNASLGTLRYLYTLGDGSGTGTRWRLQHRIANTIVQAYAGQSSSEGSIVLAADTWYHIVNAFDTSDDTVKLYINGSLDYNTARTVNTATVGMVVGGDIDSLPGISMIGSMTDFRIYDDIISAAEVTAIYNTGPELVVFESIMYIYLADLTWEAISGATSYTVSQIEDSGTEEVVASGVTDLSFTATKLNPGSSYEFMLYTNLDLVSPAATITEVAPALATAGVDSLIVRLGNDLSSLSETEVDNIESELKNVLITGDVLDIDNAPYVYVQDSDTLEYTGTSILAPFEGLVAGQEITITTPTESTLIEYDETSGEVIVNATNYSPGDFFIVGSHRVRISEI